MERGEIMIFEKLKTSIKEQRENERLKATVQEQAALLEYVATMADIDLPTLAEDTENMESEAAENERYKSYYVAGWYNEEMLKNLVAKGKLTPEEYKEITGDDYTEKEDDAEA